MNASKARILVVEDDRALRAAIVHALAALGYRILEARDGDEGLQAALQESPDLVLLDIDLPGRSGFEVCRELRRLHFAAPILMVTGMSDIEDRVTGLELGADDYLPKPFDDRELLARVSALLRRHQRGELQPRHLACGEARVDFEKRTATLAGQPLRLTRTEFALLELLARHHGRPLSRKAILDAVWSYSRTPDTRTVDTHIWRLRKKLGDSGTEPQWLKLVAGQGYCLANCSITPPPPPAPDGGG